ncbi:MAG: glycosyltransferase family 2 protein [Lachnospiraceae bacterium]|nr:glycosyltransferase family 2 protein [Lachnospiraceae bacterium]
MRTDVIIPTYKPDEKLIALLDALKKQSVPPSRIVIINTEKRYLDTLMAGRQDLLSGVDVINITEDEFDHGMTRNEGAKGSSADTLLFMTMDAVPADTDLIANMQKALEQANVAAVYARQLADDNASLSEKFSRQFNYPETSAVKSLADLDRLGIKTFFCSNACAMYDRTVFERLGKFPTDMIFNEDMVFARRIIDSGCSIAYAADAKVYHSHNYTNMQQFHRNFDLAVSQAMHPEAFGGISSESEGRSYAKAAFAYFKKAKRPLYFIPFAIACAFRLCGYRLGKRYDRLPHGLVLFCTASPKYFYRHWR